jgi:acyl-CoA oxidase
MFFSGYGNNAVEMETTATYDKSTQEFVVHTPSPLAQKYWITNGAVHAKHIVVFAKLIVDGKNEGIHGVLVPIRDSKLQVKRVFRGR